VIPATAPQEDVIIPQDSLEVLIDAARLNHPELLRLHLNRESQRIEGRLLADRLKPRINMEYNVIFQGSPMTTEGAGFEYFTNNYKLGLGLSIQFF
jgi:hypothetical protein